MVVSARAYDPAVTQDLGKWRRAGMRIVRGRQRRYLEPHRPLPWLLRGLAWSLAATSCLLLSTLALIIALGAPMPMGSGIAAAGLVMAALALAIAVTAGLARPAPLVLNPVYEEI